MNISNENLQVDPRGHKVLHTKFERVDDPTYTNEYGEHHYYREWTELYANFMVHEVNDKKFLSSSIDLAYSCGMCDEYLGYDLIGDVAVAKTECLHRNGLTTVVEVEVLSGKLICDDDLRDVEIFDLPDQEAGYNSALGQAQMVEACATVGLAYGPCGNTCPSLYEVEPGKYVVANPSYDEDTDELLPLSSGGEPVASFCTDLWAFSMADYDTYLAAGGTPVEENDHYGTRTVISVPPGRYRMTYHGGEKDFDHHGSGETIYAEFERIA